MAEVCLAGKQQEQDVTRPLANFPPNVWNYDNFLSFANVVPELDIAELEVMKEKVKDMLLNSTSHNFVEKVDLINTLYRLGLSYHFEAEIERQLQHIWDNHHHRLIAANYDLNTTALLFRVFRQHGFKISCDALFNKFMDSNGKLKEEVGNDVKGMLSLYEATYLIIHGDDDQFLDEVRDFAISKLESFAIQASPHLAQHIRNSLKWPVHFSLNRVQARQYISFYEQLDEETKNELLLKFAKLDFHIIQLLHQNELSIFLRWWKETNLASDLSYARDRPIECYFWAMGAYFEPQYSHARMLLAKSIILSSLIDDTYDAFGKLEELQLFTNAVQRFDDGTLNLDRLPNYMKPLYNALLNFADELETEFSKEGRSFCTHYEIEGLKQLVQAYYTESKWFGEDYVPSFDEYIVNALISTGFPRLIVSGLLGIGGEIVGIKEFEWVLSNPKCIKALQMGTRFTDDIVSREHESQRGHVATGIECYLKQYDTSTEEATKLFRKIVADSWKDMNEECMKPTATSKPVLMVILNFSRTIDFLYKFRDTYTYADGVKDHIRSVLFDPTIPMKN